MMNETEEQESWADFIAQRDPSEPLFIPKPPHLFANGYVFINRTPENDAACSFPLIARYMADYKWNQLQIKKLSDGANEWVGIKLLPLKSICERIDIQDPSALSGATVEDNEIIAALKKNNFQIRNSGFLAAWGLNHYWFSIKSALIKPLIAD
jgi:hypothetical protein